MRETPDSGIPSNPMPEQLPTSGGEHELLHASQPSPEALKAAYGEWLEKRDIDPASVPHLTMRQREFDLFRNAPLNYLAYTRKLYEIPGDDQNDCQYALVDVEPDDANLPHQPQLTIVNEADFGTVIDQDIIAKDFQHPESDPNGPPMPDLPHGAYKTVDIGETIAMSWKGLNNFATNLMRGKTTNPFSGEGDIGVRAGEPASAQKDAYVWTRSPFAESVGLTVAFPSQYDSVCVVRGEKREPANGKAGMAQIVDPEVVLKIEGKNLSELQGIYRELYHEPNFALTEQQRRERDELFNAHIVGIISDAVKENRERAAYEAREQQSLPPALRARERPLP